MAPDQSVTRKAGLCRSRSSEGVCGTLAVEEPRCGRGVLGVSRVFMAPGGGSGGANDRVSGATRGLGWL